MVAKEAPPISEEEFKLLIYKLKSTKRKGIKANEQIVAYTVSYNTGLKLNNILLLTQKDVENYLNEFWMKEEWIEVFPLSLSRRTLQRGITNILGKPFNSLRVGYVLKKFNQGYPLNYIHKRLGFDNGRGDENRIIRRFSSPSAKKRLVVLKRDKFTCVFCGRKPPEVKLHVDHIVPVSKGGSVLTRNLQTLCQLCNMSKGDQLI